MRRIAALVPLASLVLAALGAATAAAKDPEEIPPFGAEKAPYESLRRRLGHATHASVSTVCGSSLAPWAYRGPSSPVTLLRAHVTNAAGEEWTHRFVATLMRPADWDSAKRCLGPDRPCDGNTASPMVAVRLDTRTPVYVLLLFETRCAVVFEADQALGSVAMSDRADSLFALVQQALPPPARLPALPERVAAWADTDTILPLGQFAVLDSLPEIVRRVTPVYPSLARNAASSGTVWVRALVGRDGFVHDAFVERPKPYLDSAALDAVWQWQFRPAVRRGAPVATWVAIPVRFTLR